ncbi:MAG TPA: hypothetical protein VEF35_02220 [Candidatus Bathyarchaeia archaeon]|nr:hypothetical protein [Candidatus Bathyarchaeia archaeon]
MTSGVYATDGGWTTYYGLNLGQHDSDAKVTVKCEEQPNDTKLMAAPPPDCGLLVLFSVVRISFACLDANCNGRSDLVCT